MNLSAAAQALANPAVFADALKAHDDRLKVLSQDDNSMFIPKRLEPVKYEGKTLQAYPFTGSDAPPAERIYALQCNRKAAENAFLGPQQVIAFYASRLDLDSQARIAMSQWTGRINQQWNDPARLTVLGYYEENGTLLNNAIDPATGVLRPITDGTAVTRRPAGVRFAKVRLAIDYSDIIQGGVPCTVNLDFYLKLPQGDIQFTTPAGVVETRHTCNIDGNPFGLDRDAFRDQVLIPTATNGPIDILPPRITGHACRIDESDIIQLLQRQVLTVGADSIFASLREVMAPGYAATAHATVEKIKMAFTDSSGNTHTLTVQEYYNGILQGSISFLEDDVYQYNVANHFVLHLESSLRDKFMQKCTEHLTFSDLSRDAQMRQLSKYLVIATQCERDMKATQKIVTNTMNNAHAFLGNILSALGVEITDQGVLSTNLSAAERTLAKYQQTGPKEEIVQMVRECWGCRGTDHAWRDRKSKKILCPNKDKPGVAERAKQMHEQYLEKNAERRGFIPKAKIKFSQLSKDQKEAAKKRFLAEIAHVPASDTTASTDVSSVTAPTAPRSYPAYLIAATTPGKPHLPISVNPQLPHINVVLGSLDTPLGDCAVIRGLYDTGASLSSGYGGHWFPILENHPDCIVEMHSSDKGQYTPIILGGVVTGEDGDMSSHTTALTVVVKILLRYETVTHQPVTHSIAIGNSVGVNTILGAPFIESLQCVHDSHNNVVEAKLLNCEPFRVTKLQPQRYNTTKLPGKSDPVYSSIIAKLNEYHSLMTQPAPTPATPVTPGVDDYSGFQPAPALIESKKRGRVLDEFLSDDENVPAIRDGASSFHLLHGLHAKE